MFPIGEVAAIGRVLGVPLIVDNTAAPIVCRPLEHGAAIVVHSTTKYIGGHGTSIGGLIVDGGNFDWAAHARRFPTLCEPDPCYHGAVWTEAVKPLGPIAYIVRARVVLLRDLGAAMSPFNAFQFIQGLETLPLRMRQHCRNAAEVALYLQRHPAVARVIYAGMHDNAMQHRRAATYLKGGFGGLVGLRAEGRARGGRTLHRRAEACSTTSPTSAMRGRSPSIRPRTTHSQLSPADQLASGVTPGYVRLSVGIEHIDDIIADLDQALAAAAMPDGKERRIGAERPHLTSPTSTDFDRHGRHRPLSTLVRSWTHVYDRSCHARRYPGRPRRRPVRRRCRRAASFMPTRAAVPCCGSGSCCATPRAAWPPARRALHPP